MKTVPDIETPFIRRQARSLAGKLSDASSSFVQVVIGPRKSGKSTVVRQASQIALVPLCIADVSDAALPGTRWIIENWQKARNIAREADVPCALVFEGIETRLSWAQTASRLWDADLKNGISVKPIFVFDEDSSAFSISDLDKHMLGCYEVTRCPYWSFAECKDAFSFTLDDYLLFGGIPGASTLASEPSSWQSYLLNNVVAPVLAEESRARSGIMKPGLLEDYIGLIMNFASQELSYNSALSYLPNVKNTITLARYLDYLQLMGTAIAVEKFRPEARSGRRSSPRVLPRDVGIANALTGMTAADLARSRQLRGSLIDCAVGAHLYNMGKEGGFEVFYWREGNRAVDFVAWDGRRATAIDVQSGHIKRLSGSGRFSAKFPGSDLLVIGNSFGSSISIEEFLSADLLPRLEPSSNA